MRRVRLSLPRSRLVVCLALTAIVAGVLGGAAGVRLTRSAGDDWTAPPAGPKRYAVRGIYDRDFTATGFDREAALGFNFIDSGPSDDFSLLAARGLRGFVWLGGYDNDRCTFRETDAWVRSRVSALARDPGVGAYFIDDEPDAAACPTAPAQMKARSDLVKSIDPEPPTFLVTYKIEQFRLFAGTVDVLGLDGYPCTIRRGCNYSRIDRQAAEADRLGVRYWGVIQAWGDDWYRLPTPAELHTEFVHWRATRMEGYIVFAWRYPDDMPELWLANHPELQAQLDRENGMPPNTRIVRRPRGTSGGGKAVFRFVSTERASRFHCRLDRGAWLRCRSPRVYRGLSSGPHAFRVRALDWVGNTDPTPAIHRWRVSQ